MLVDPTLQILNFNNKKRVGRGLDERCLTISCETAADVAR
jgi:hypothetical protein